MNDIKNSERALEIQEELRGLAYFIETVCDLPEKSKYFEKKSLFNLKIKNNLQLSIFGMRYFQPGLFVETHEQTIKVPYSLIPFLKEAGCDKIRALMEEIKTL